MKNVGINEQLVLIKMIKKKQLNSLQIIQNLIFYMNKFINVF